MVEGVFTKIHKQKLARPRLSDVMTTVFQGLQKFDCCALGV